MFTGSVLCLVDPGSNQGDGARLSHHMDRRRFHEGVREIVHRVQHRQHPVLDELRDHHPLRGSGQSPYSHLQGGCVVSAVSSPQVVGRLSHQVLVYCWDSLKMSNICHFIKNYFSLLYGRQLYMTSAELSRRTLHASLSSTDARRLG